MFIYDDSKKSKRSRRELYVSELDPLWALIDAVRDQISLVFCVIETRGKFWLWSTGLALKVSVWYDLVSSL